MLQSRAFRAVNLEVVRILARRYNVLRLLDPDSGPHRVSELLGLGRLQGVLSLHIICRMWELSHRRSVRPFLEESRPRLHLQKSPPLALLHLLVALHMCCGNRSCGELLAVRTDPTQFFTGVAHSRVLGIAVIFGCLRAVSRRRRDFGPQGTTGNRAHSLGHLQYNSNP